MGDDASPSAIGGGGPRQFEPKGLHWRRSRLRGTTIEFAIDRPDFPCTWHARHVFLFISAGTVSAAALNCRDAGVSTCCEAQVVTCRQPVPVGNRPFGPWPCRTSAACRDAATGTTCSRGAPCVRVSNGTTHVGPVRRRPSRHQASPERRRLGLERNPSGSPLRHYFSSDGIHTNDTDALLDFSRRIDPDERFARRRTSARAANGN